MSLEDEILSRMTAEEAAVVKAQIVIVKGGKFTDAGTQSGAFGNVQAEGSGTDKVCDGYKDGEIIKVQLNPNTYSIKSSTSYKNEKMGGMKESNGTFGVFGPPRPRELSVTLFYDAKLQADYLEKLKAARQQLVQSIQTEAGFVKGSTSLLQAYKKFEGKEDLNKLYLDKLLGLTHMLKGINTPALISFQYGSTIFEGYTRSVSVEYQRFNKEGEVIRAQVNLSIEESNIFAEKEQAEVPAAAAPDLSSKSKVLPTDTLPT